MFCGRRSFSAAQKIWQGLYRVCTSSATGVCSTQATSGSRGANCEFCSSDRVQTISMKEPLKFLLQRLQQPHRKLRMAATLLLKKFKIGIRKIVASLEHELTRAKGRTNSSIVVTNNYCYDCSNGSSIQRVAISIFTAHPN